MSWELEDQNNWSLVVRQTYTAAQISTVPPKFQPIPPKLIGVEQKILLIGTRNDQAKDTWYTAGWVSSRLNFSPSNNSSFSGLVQGSTKYRLSLNKLNLVKFNNYDQVPYVLEINIARWHTQLLVEIWQYSGTTDDIENSLARIEEKLDMNYGQ
jgi:hypothetical protein